MAAVSIPFQLSSASKLWRRYNTALKTSPLATKSLTCMAAYSVGDIISQVTFSKAPNFIKRISDVDAARTARMAAYAMLWCGPAGHVFYKALDKVFQRHVRNKVATIAGKVGVDQLVYSPISTAIFFAWANLAGGTPANLPDDLSTKLAPSVQAAWALWVPAMTVNMALVPPEARVLFINATAIVWTIVLSGMAGEPELPATMDAGVDALGLAALLSVTDVAPPCGRTGGGALRRTGSASKQNEAGPRGKPRFTFDFLPDLKDAVDKKVSDLAGVGRAISFAASRSMSTMLHDEDAGAASEFGGTEDCESLWEAGPVDMELCLA